MKSIEKKSKRYREIFKGMDQSRSYKIDEAVKLIKDKSKTKFVESIDLSVNLNIKKEKSNNTLKGDLIRSVFATSTMGVSYKVKLGKSI